MKKRATTKPRAKAKDARPPRDLEPRKDRDVSGGAVNMGELVIKKQSDKSSSQIFS